MKKLLSVLLALGVLIGVLGGCSKSNDNTKVNLIWAIPTSEQKDYELVIKEVNKLLEEKLPNTTLELKQDSAMSTKWSLWMAGKKTIDIASSGYATNLATEINRNAYLELNDLIEEYAPTIKAEWEEYDIDYASGMMDGKLYAIPDLQIHINDQFYFGVPEYYYQYLDVEALQKAVKENITTTQVFYDIINNYLEEVSKHPNEQNTGKISYVEYTFKSLVKRGFEFIGGTDTLLCYRLDDEETKVLNFYETEEYKLWIENAAKWYSKGYISKDILTGDSDSDKDGLFTCNVVNMRVIDRNNDGILTPEEQNSDGISNSTSYKISLTDESQKYLGVTVLGKLAVYLSIPSTSQNPERAIQLLELLRKDEGRDILNTLVYGIEGKHYEKTGENTIKAFEYNGQGGSSSSYGLPNWMMGNQLKMYICSPYNEDTYNAAVQYYKEDRPNYKKTRLYKFSTDNTKVENEIAQMAAIDEEFLLQLIGGVSDSKYNETYKKMMDKLKAAGIDDVVKEYQQQCDSYGG